MKKIVKRIPLLWIIMSCGKDSTTSEEIINTPPILYWTEKGVGYNVFDLFV